jgi:hypothetical protein
MPVAGGPLIARTLPACSAGGSECVSCEQMGEMMGGMMGQMG